MEMPGIPSARAFLQDNGSDERANTKTQCETIASDERTKDLRSIVLVTSSYHIPRVQRTAGKVLSKATKFVVIADMQDYTTFNVYLKVLGEINRILEYSEKGDILAWPR
jgi:translation elongation factor P/translation initiation factor 5A